MSAWMPIESAPKDRPVDWWTQSGEHITGVLYSVATQLFDGLTHWRESDKGPDQEEGDVRWMIEDDGDLWSQTFECKRDAVKNQALIDDYLSDQSRVVRVRIVKEEK